MLTASSHRIISVLTAVLGIVAVGYISVVRINQERANNTVAIAVDYTEVSQAAALSGVTVGKFLVDLRQAGATHVAVTEQSLEQARLEWTARAASQLRNKVPGSQYSPTGSVPAESAPPMPQLGVGYDETAVQLVHNAGLGIIARPLPDFVHTPPAANVALDTAKHIGARLVVFAGPKVLGYKGLISFVATGMQRRRLAWGMIEMVPQAGEHALAKALGYKLIRTHSISASEMEQTSIPEAIQRFSLAVRERKVRLCYVHLSFTGTDPLTDNVRYVHLLARRLAADGFHLGSPAPYSPVAAPPAIRLLLMLVVGLGAAMLWAATLGIGGPRLSCAVGAVCTALAYVPWIGALLAALIFPTLAVCSLHLKEHPTVRPLWDGLVLFVGVSLTSLFGGLVVAAFLTDLPHLVGVQLFRGVKLAQLLPLVVVAFVFAARSATSYRQVRWETGERGAEWPALRAGLQEVLSYSVRYWHVLAVAFALGLLAMLVMRSGNEPLLPVSGLEIKLRALLDSTLGVRPRTKEIFFAHPLMVLALIWLCRGRRRGLWILLTAGAIGQVSIVNTFCHLHTPLLVSLARACNGLWIGIIGGIVLWGLIWLFTRRIVVQSRPADPGG